MAEPKAIHGLDDQGRVNRCQDSVLTAVDGAKIEGGSRLDPCRAPMVIHAQAGRDHGDPGVEAALAGKSGHGAQSPGKRLLGHLFGGMTVADPLQAKTLQPVAIAAIQLVEGGGIPGLEPLDQCSVSVEVYIIGLDSHEFPTLSRPDALSLPSFCGWVGTQDHQLVTTR